MIKDLQYLGLSKNEAIVYEMLVKHGSCKAGLIIPKLDIHRNLVYRALESLVENGYATRVIKSGVWYFQITDPHILLTNIKRREKIFADILTEIEQYQDRVTRQIVVYEGLESYRNYWVRSVERMPEGTTDYVAGGVLAQWHDVLGKKTLEEYYKIVKGKKMKWKQIYFGLSDRELKTLKESPVPSESRIIRSSKSSDFWGGNFNIIHDTVILHTMNTKKNIYRIIEMRDPELVSLFKNHFVVT